MVGEILRFEREKRGLMQFQVAKRLGVSPATLCRYENGQQDVPPDVLAQATRMFRCPKLADEKCRHCPVAQARADVMKRKAA